MNWDEKYKASEQPDMPQIVKFINNPYWSSLCNFIEDTYKVSPKIEYSSCSMKRGWNVKYKKSGKAICTLYPNEGFFTCMVSIKDSIATEAEMLIPALTDYTRNIFINTETFNGSRWLMLDIYSEDVFNDVKTLIELRMKK